MKLYVLSTLINYDASRPSVDVYKLVRETEKTYFVLANGMERRILKSDRTYTDLDCLGEYVRQRQEKQLAKIRQQMADIESREIRVREVSPEPYAKIDPFQIKF